LIVDVRLPDGWHWVKLEEICLLIQDGNYGGSYPKKEEWVQEGIPFLTAAVLGRRGEILESNLKYITLAKHSELLKAQITTNDVIFPNRGSRDSQMNGAEPIAFLISDRFKEANINPQLTLLRSNQKIILPEFLVVALNSPVFLAQFRKATTGSALRFINLTTTKLMGFPLPPLNEQRRIVSTIEQLTDQSNKARTALEDVPKLIAQFRQSVLAAAFRGDLTADWREKNPDVEPASELLERIKIDSLPQRWCEINIGQVIEGLKYGTSQKCGYESIGVPVLRIPNIGEGKIELSDLKYAKLPEKELESLKLRTDDILLIRSNGSVSLVGKTALVSEVEEGYAYAGYLIRLRVNQKLVNPKYLNLCFSSHSIRLQIELPARSTSGVNNINSTEVQKLRISLPPLAEQVEIISRLEKCFKSIQIIEEQYNNSHEQLETLDRSILAKAFRGELVPQDPNDEPAAVLLDRIRAEREQTSSNKQRGKTTRKNSSKQLSIDLE